jgi:hypothetical protein
MHGGDDDGDGDEWQRLIVELTFISRGITCVNTIVNTPINNHNPTTSNICRTRVARLVYNPINP